MLPELLAAARRYPAVEFFIFGSVARGAPDVSDIDILIIYDLASELPPVKSEIAAISHTFPLHVLYMSRDEEKQFCFIEKEDAKPVETLFPPLVPTES